MTSPSMDSRWSCSSSVDVFQCDVEDSRRGSEEMADLLLKLCEENAVSTKKADVKAARERLGLAIHGPKQLEPSTLPPKRASIGFFHTRSPDPRPRASVAAPSPTDAEGGSPNPRSRSPPAVMKSKKPLGTMLSFARSSRSSREDAGARRMSLFRELLLPKLETKAARERKRMAAEQKAREEEERIQIEARLAEVRRLPAADPLQPCKLPPPPPRPPPSPASRTGARDPFIRERRSHRDDHEVVDSGSPCTQRTQREPPPTMRGERGNTHRNVPPPLSKTHSSPAAMIRSPRLTRRLEPPNDATLQLVQA